MNYSEIWELSRLNAQYWNCADSNNSISVSSLFISDGCLELGNLKLEGKKNIQDFFDKRVLLNTQSGRLTRHISSDYLYERISEDKIKSSCKVIVYSNFGPSIPLRVLNPSTIADVEDLFVIDSEKKWKFASRIIKPIFIGDGAPSFATKMES